ncbi:restriction endonuclease [Flavobacteriaceae bacterium Ap0902]|nr:restriction endonuclease [Flavobacteriaceae bacterium Ap0902]
MGNKSLENLQQTNPNLLVFPQSLGQHKDDVEKPKIFSLRESKLTTNNLMGFVGRNSSQLTIASRFANDDHNDYFMHYMLQKVFAINLLDFEQTRDKENIWDFYIYLFPYFLKKAYAQGLYKAYKREEYNDANVKGAIDVNRQIQKNIPFTGRIAYSTREHSYNNALNQLIRHTIEFIKTHPFGNGVLLNDYEVRGIVSKFNFITQRSYNKNARNKIISQNLKPVSHAYFSEYKLLQKLCLQILRYEKLTYGKKNDDSIYGLLFDGAWLWEEYLNTFLVDLNFKHPENKKGKGRIYLFSNNKISRYPDFWKENIILDAKYKKLSNSVVNRYDINQIISYMHVTQSNIGGFIIPSERTMIEEIGTLNGYGGKVIIIRIQIPKEVKSFREFNDIMNQNEKELKDKIVELTAVE